MLPGEDVYVETRVRRRLGERWGDLLAVVTLLRRFDSEMLAVAVAPEDLDDAESYVKKAIDLCKKTAAGSDVRMQITLARVQIAKGDLGRARATLRQVRSRQDGLSKFDLGEVEKLQKALTAKGK